MSNTLFDLTLRVAIELGAVKQGTATGGATNTIIDTNLLATLEDDFYTNGTYWVTGTTDGLAPKSEAGIISDFTKSTGTANLQDALSSAIAAGDTYAMAIPRFRLFEIKQQINQALYISGYIPVVDTSLTTGTNQREYTLPAAATRDLRKVEIYTNADSDRNLPMEVFNYQIRHTATGSADTLVLDKDYSQGLTIALTYAAQHASLEDMDDDLNEAIHPDRIVYAAAAQVMRNYRDRRRARHLDVTIEHLEQMAEIARQTYPLPPLPVKPGKILVFNRSLDAGWGGSL